MAVTNPIGFSDELKLASTAKASSSDGVLLLVAHDHELSASAIDAEGVHRVNWQAASVDAAGNLGGCTGRSSMGILTMRAVSPLHLTVTRVGDTVTQ
jgi:hypothetical protein